MKNAFSSKKLTGILLVSGIFFVIMFAAVAGLRITQRIKQANAEFSALRSLVAVTDQKNAQILVLDPAVTDWNSDSAVQWSWYPNENNGFSKKTSGWRLPSEVKLRNSRFFKGQVMIVTDSDGFAAAIPYPAGNTKYWSAYLGTAPNLHSIELLPDGNIALAASTGGWVRIYTSSQAPDSNKFAEYKLPQAHGVLWDPEKKVLGALGDTYLTGLKITGTVKEPKIEEDTSLRINLPSAHGHDLQPVYGNKDRLWVSTGSWLYQYVKSTKSWNMDYPGIKRLSRASIKSVGNQEAGQPVIETVPNNTLNSWCTNTIEFFNVNGEPNYETRKRDSMAVYKARYLNPDYQ